MISSKSLEVLIVLGLCISFAHSIKMKQPKCRGKDLHVSEEDMKGLQDCIKEVTPDIKPAEGDEVSKVSKAIPKEKMACFYKCLLKVEGMIDDKGKPCKDKLMGKLNSTMPEEVLDEMDTAMAKCVDEHGKNVDPEEKNCQSYNPLTQCMTVAYVQVCKEDKEKE